MEAHIADNLPSSWTVATVHEITLAIEQVDPNQDPHREFSYLDISSIDNSANVIADGKRYLGSDAPSRARQKVKAGDILFSTVRTYLRNIARVPSIYDGAIGSTGFSVLRCAEGVDPDYLFYYTLTPAFLNSLADLQRGSSYPAVRDKDVQDQIAPIPPGHEQRRIVAKLEELFSELDQGIESLKTAREQLKVYRQALLKHAFEGKLTAAWRAENPDKLESAEVLLERIHTEREQRYQQQLSEWQENVRQWEASGSEGRKPSAPANPKDVSPVTVAERAEHPDLPKGWIYVRAEDISDFITKGTTPSKHLLFPGEGGVPFLKVYNRTKTGHVDFSVDPTFVSEETHKGLLQRSQVVPDDVLMNIVGPPLGKVAIVPATYQEWNINQAIVRFRSSVVSSQFLCHFLLSEATVRSMEKRSKTTAGQVNLTLEICRATLVPFCSPAEQNAVVAILSEKLSDSERTDRELRDSIDRAEALRQSILKKAFAGQLVPQDPDDEPASVLLERIRAAKVASSNGGPRRRMRSG